MFLATGITGKQLQLIVKLSGHGNGSAIMPQNSLGGSTVQWGTGPRTVCNDRNYVITNITILLFYVLNVQQRLKSTRSRRRTECDSEL